MNRITHNHALEAFHDVNMSVFSSEDFVQMQVHNQRTEQPATRLLATQISAQGRDRG